MSKAIYSGLTNTQAFNVMTATMQCWEELPHLEQWSRRQHWLLGSAIATVVTVVMSAIVSSVTGSAAAGAGSAIGWLICVLLTTWLTARRTESRRTYLRALAQGLEQLNAAAERKPGASADELLNLMPS